MLAASFWLPEDFSTHGAQIDQLIKVVHWFMLALFVGWGIFFVYCLIKYRAREGHTADYSLIKAKPSKYVEVLVILIEAGLLLGISMPVWADWRGEVPAASDRMEVRCIAEQFAWNFHYPGPDGQFGRVDPKLVDVALNPVGIDESDPAAADDLVQVGNLTIPVDTTIYLRLTSKDVIHSFGVMKLRLKQDVIPGMEIPIWFEADETAEVDIMCAQLCGITHYSMQGRVNIKSKEEYDAWAAAELEKKTAEPEVFDEDMFD